MLKVSFAPSNIKGYHILHYTTQELRYTYKSSAISHLNLQAFVQPRLQLFTAKWLLCRRILQQYLSMRSKP